MINTTDFSKEYTERLIDKSLSLEEVVFKCGHINIQKFIGNFFTILGNQHKILSFLICKVHLGKIGSSSDPDVTNCDSIYLQPEASEDVFQYNYFIRNPTQYAILYEVTFTTTDEK
jgi:hypothetical protein